LHSRSDGARAQAGRRFEGGTAASSMEEGNVIAEAGLAALLDAHRAE
jgi:hypothetical protein